VFLWLHRQQQKFSHAFRHWVVHRYGSFLELTLNHRYLTVIIAFSILITTLSFALSGRMVYDSHLYLFRQKYLG
jgi:Cu/Ag efflux pump CusA